MLSRTIEIIAISSVNNAPSETAVATVKLEAKHFCTNIVVASQSALDAYSGVKIIDCNFRIICPSTVNCDIISLGSLNYLQVAHLCFGSDPPSTMPINFVGNYWRAGYYQHKDTEPTWIAKSPSIPWSDIGHQSRVNDNCRTEKCNH